MTDKTKKIIAREGLIILGITLSGFLISFVSDYIWQHNKAYIDFMASVPWRYEPLSLKLFWNRALSVFSIYNFPFNTYISSSPYHKVWFPEWTEHLGEFIFLWGYIIYLPIRFISWSVRTLRGSK